MKKKFEHRSQIEIENNSKNILPNLETKTTNVNILLNRVRLDKQKTFKKKILISLLVVSLVCVITIFLII